MKLVSAVALLGLLLIALLSVVALLALPGKKSPTGAPLDAAARTIPEEELVRKHVLDTADEPSSVEFAHWDRTS
jgi:hypothetical protein